MSSLWSSPLGFAARKAFGQPTFLVAAVSLLMAAVGLNGAVAKMQLHFKKLPVPLARELNAIGPDLGDWLQVSRDEPLDKEIQDVLGTDKYVFRDYVNLTNHGGACGADFLLRLSPAATKDELAAIRAEYLAKPQPARKQMLLGQLKEKTTTDRKKALAAVQAIHPDAVINMAVTYYTGLVDTVAHIPDRCYIADGFQPTDYDFPTWDLGGGKQLQVRFINFQDQNGTSRIDRSVAYFFHVNGHFESNPLGVRSSLQNLLEKYGYYSKVELMTLDPDHARSALTMTDFLSAALPEVQKSFPDWYKVNHQK